MLSLVQAKEILQILQSLPADQIAEVIDYLNFLRERYAAKQSTDMGASWSDEDISDLLAASLVYAEKTVWSGES